MDRRLQVVAMAWMLALCHAQQLYTYVAGPHQLSLLHTPSNSYRFAYLAENQFRAERRFPNGTVVGYYGFIGADNKPVRVKYTSVDDLGFQANSELIPEEFVTEETSTDNPEEVVAPPAGAENLNKLTASDKVTKLGHSSVFSDKESISIDAAQVNDLNLRTVFSAPHFELNEFIRKRRSLPELLANQRRLMKLKSEGEPTVIYADRLPVLKASTHFTVQ